MSPQRKYPRTARVNEVMLEVLADELERMSDPRLELVTLTGVDVTRDLAYATVYYSTLAATAADAPRVLGRERRRRVARRDAASAGPRRPADADPPGAEAHVRTRPRHHRRPAHRGDPPRYPPRRRACGRRLLADEERGS